MVEAFWIVFFLIFAFGAIWLLSAQKKDDIKKEGIKGTLNNLLQNDARFVQGRIYEFSNRLTDSSYLIISESGNIAIYNTGYTEPIILSINEIIDIKVNIDDSEKTNIGRAVGGRYFVWRRWGNTRWFIKSK
jgi:hypothetical protein